VEAPDVYMNNNPAKVGQLHLQLEVPSPPIPLSITLCLFFITVHCKSCCPASPNLQDHCKKPCIQKSLSSPCLASDIKNLRVVFVLRQDKILYATESVPRHARLITSHVLLGLPADRSHHTYRIT